MSFTVIAVVFVIFMVIVFGMLWSMLGSNPSPVGPMPSSLSDDGYPGGHPDPDDQEP